LYNDNIKKTLIPLPPLSEQRRIVEILDRFDTLTNSISEGLPREIALRRKQYEYYRDALLRFPPTGTHGLRGSRHSYAQSAHSVGKACEFLSHVIFNSKESRNFAP